MKRLLSVIVLAAILTVPFSMNARTVEEDWVAPIVNSEPLLLNETAFEYTIGHKPSGKEGDFGLFPFLGKSFYRFVLKPAYIATKASGKTGGKAVRFFFVQIGHFLF